MRRGQLVIALLIAVVIAAATAAATTSRLSGPGPAAEQEYGGDDHSGHGRGGDD